VSRLGRRACASDVQHACGAGRARLRLDTLTGSCPFGGRGVMCRSKMRLTANMVRRSRLTSGSVFDRISRSSILVRTHHRFMSIMPVKGNLGREDSFKTSVRPDGFFEITQEKPGSGMIVLHHSEAKRFVEVVRKCAQKAKEQCIGRVAVTVAPPSVSFAPPKGAEAPNKGSLEPPKGC